MSFNSATESLDFLYRHFLPMSPIPRPSTNSDYHDDDARQDKPTSAYEKKPSCAGFRHPCTGRFGQQRQLCLLNAKPIIRQRIGQQPGATGMSMGIDLSPATRRRKSTREFCGNQIRPKDTFADGLWYKRARAHFGPTATRRNARDCGLLFF